MIKSFQPNANALILHGLTPANLFTPKRRRFASQNRRTGHFSC
jgi:hypothetical protein